MREEPAREEPGVPVPPAGPPAQITPESPLKPVKIAYPQRSTRVFQIFEHELDSLGSISNSLNLTFTGIAFGAALTLFVTLTTVTAWNSPYMYATYVAVFIFSMILLVNFGIRSGLDIRKARKEIKRIKEESPSATA